MISNDCHGTEMVTDPEKIADKFQDHFCSVFSNPENPNKQLPSYPAFPIEYPMSDIIITNEKIIKAVSKIHENSSGPDGDIPARVLKECRFSLSKPLNLLFTKSYETGIVPQFYKKQSVCPLHKKGSKVFASNYRPISITSHVIKTFERIIKEHICEYLELNALISDCQHGFRNGRSCLTQLLQHHNNIMQNLIEGHDTDVIYLDYAKAFDSVDHELLMEKLRKYGISNKLLEWLQSFLRHRSQTVVVDKRSSYTAPVISGVPQGTVLGPLLFIIFINDISLLPLTSNIGIFADDTKITRRIEKSEQMADLQSDLNEILLWSKKNNMQLNEDKFQFISHNYSSNMPILHSLPFTNSHLHYTTTEGNEVFPLSSVRDLGVLISDDLSWSPHIRNIASSARTMVAWVLNVFRTRAPCVMLTLYRSLIRSKLEYCSPVWHSSKLADIRALENIQRSFTVSIEGMKDLDYWKRLETLKLSSLQRRRERFMVFHAWKILNARVPNDVGLNFTPNRVGHLKAIVKPLPRSSARSQTLHENSFVVHAARLWNLLPNHVTTIDSFPAFKVAVDNFLGGVPDRPPIEGYPNANDNSLIHVLHPVR